MRDVIAKRNEVCSAGTPHVDRSDYVRWGALPAQPIGPLNPPRIMHSWQVARYINHSCDPNLRILTCTGFRRRFQCLSRPSNHQFSDFGSFGYSSALLGLLLSSVGKRSPSNCAVCGAPYPSYGGGAPRPAPPRPRPAPPRPTATPQPQPPRPCDDGAHKSKVSFSYGDRVDAGGSAHPRPCLCGASNCMGFLPYSNFSH